MSITYPEAQSSRNVNTSAPAMGGSALFPAGAANLYDRARGARGARSGKSGGLPIAWIAAPVAVVLIGGAIAVSLPHHAAVPSSASRSATTTTSTAAPALSQAAAPTTQAAAPVAKSDAPAAPVAAKTVTHRVAQSATRIAPAQRVQPSSGQTTTRSTTTETLPTGPVPYVQSQGAQTDAGAQQAQPTPGNFAYTAPAPAQTNPAPPATPSATPAAANDQAPAQPQG